MAEASVARGSTAALAAVGRASVGRPHLSGEVRQSDGFVGFGCHLGHKELVVYLGCI